MAFDVGRILLGIRTPPERAAEKYLKAMQEEDTASINAINCTGYVPEVSQKLQAWQIVYIMDDPNGPDAASMFISADVSFTDSNGTLIKDLWDIEVWESKEWKSEDTNSNKYCIGSIAPQPPIDFLLLDEFQ